MIEYKIKIDYNTGDSFNTHEHCIDYLDYGWKNLDVVKENLKRIKEHYTAYLAIEKSYSNKQIKNWDSYKNERWYCKQYPAFSITLLKDDETDFTVSSGLWCGYFESLNSAEIEFQDLDMKITF